MKTITGAEQSGGDKKVLGGGTEADENTSNSQPQCGRQLVVGACGAASKVDESS